MEGLRSFAENMTMHGIYRILTSKNKLFKAFWLVVLLASSSYVIYQLNEIFKDYSKHDVFITMEKRIQTRLKFPSVTFCPGGGEMQSFTSDDIRNQTKLEEKLANADRGKTFIRWYQFHWGVDHKYLKYPAHFTKKLLPYNGLCYTFNPDGRLFQYIGGKTFGLHIGLFLNTTKNYAKWVEVSLHQHDEFPFPFLDGIVISPGFSTYIALKKRTILRRQSPYRSDCTLGKKEHLLFPGKHTLENCQVTCYIEESINSCKTGTLPWESFVYVSKVNKPKLLKNAIDFVEGKCLYNDNSSLLALLARCNCRVPCNEVKFEKMLSFMKTGYDKLSEVNIYFHDLSNEIVTETPVWSFTKLLSDIGGMTGIWLGASVLSIIEMFILFSKTPGYLLRNRRGMNQKTEDIKE